MEIFAEIKGLKYKPMLCGSLDTYEYLEKAVSEDTKFILEIDNKNKIAISLWVSPKRTRTYPLARVYDTLNFTGKRVTIIPVMKDEGKDGDRDFLQWDTISLMSLLGVYVIISYYIDASKSPKYKNKITDQILGIDYIKTEIQRLLSYQSDALHWNLSQIDKIHELAQNALDSYENISRKLDAEMHSKDSALRRIDELRKGKERFMELSRELAYAAQQRESVTNQPKEHLSGKKATITIKNYLGGYYYFTCDEVEIHRDEVHLVEGKHTKTDKLPSSDDIKDGLLKMALFTNLENVIIEGHEYKPKAVLKLTTGDKFDFSLVNETQKELLEILGSEAIKNGFRIKINDKFFV